ncbi:MAG: Gfo/Idh/MocA family oxidoreductase [Armatimonadetes bacterium]|nr:Gfo/Idh/MocA family oxidoreductase [Armatimonadota bacterium]
MSNLRVALIGTGKKKDRPDRFGYAMAYQHALAYQKIEGCELVACADISEQNGQDFAEKFEVPAGGVFTDYRTMLAEARPETVSICTWMHLHEEMVLAAIEAGVKAIHCEKPMADTWAGSKRMAEAAAQAGVQLTFNHQRRYGEPFQIARQLLEDGEIGKLLRFECEFGNIYDTGTHFIDMLSFYLGDGVPAKWVIAQVDYRTENRVFGAHCENQQVMLWEYQNGVFGFVYSGRPGDDGKPLGVVNRLIGEQGVIDVGFGHGPDAAIRWMKSGDTEWRLPDTGKHSIHGPDFIDRALADVVDCYRSGRKCMLDASNALVATELIFGAYESSRRRGRVDLPLDPSVGNPLAEMVEAGDLQVEGL